MNKLIWFSVYFSLFGCSQFTAPKDTSYSVVEFDELESKEIVQIEKESNVDYGPPLVGESDSTETDSKTRPVLAIDFLPSLYFSIGYVSTIKELEKQGVQVDIVSSFGFSSVVAALYAKYGIANMIEWKMFELYQELENLKPYGSEWKKKVVSFMAKEFKSLRLNQLNKVLIVPYVSNGQIKFDLNQKVVSAVAKTIDLSSKTSLMGFNRYDYLNKIESFGADDVLRIGLLPKVISFKRPDGFMLGIFTRIKSATDGDAFSPNLNSIGHLDYLENISDYLNLVKEANEEFSKYASKTIKEEAGNN